MLTLNSPAESRVESMRFGMFVPQGWRHDLVGIEPAEHWEAMRGLAEFADASPWDSIWVYDHFHTIPEPTMNTVFEAWTISAALARDTSRVNIGQMVGCNGYRHPALYAKMASTVDVASHGRLYAGLAPGQADADSDTRGDACDCRFPVRHPAERAHGQQGQLPAGRRRERPR